MPTVPSTTGPGATGLSSKGSSPTEPVAATPSAAGRPGSAVIFTAVIYAAVLVAVVILPATSHAEAASHPVLVITGGNADQQRNIEAFVAPRRLSCSPLPEFRERGVIRDVTQRAGRALRALGHYQPELTFSIEPGEPCWTLLLELEPGPATTITDIDITITGPGADDPGFAALRANPGIAIGDELRHDRYDQLRNRLARIAADRGFLNAQLQRSELKVDPETAEAWIILHLESGPRHRLGAVTLDQDILNPEFVARFIPFEPGDWYSAASLLNLQSNLNQSGFFQSVRVRPQLDAIEDATVPVRVELDPRKRSAYELRLGFSTDRGPRFGAGFERYYINRRGHSFRSDMELSPKRSGLSLNYTIPLRDPLNEHINVFASASTEDTSTRRSDLAQIGVSRVRQRSSGWQITEGLRYEYDDSFIAGERTLSRMLMPSYRLFRLTADDPLFPQRGLRIDLLGQGAAEQLGSSLSIAQMSGNVKTIHGFGNGRLLLRGDAGITVSEARITDIPGTMRFYAGGDTSIRGFGFQKLGPRNDQGQVIGGRYLLVGSVEYDHPLPNWPVSLAAFVDGGNAFDAFDDYDAKLGFGFGVRWRSPLGPLRLDFAHAPDSEDNFRIHFTMGPDL